MKQLDTPDDIGAWFVFLSSDYSSCATGQTYLIDGGKAAVMMEVKYTLIPCFRVRLGQYPDLAEQPRIGIVENDRIRVLDPVSSTYDLFGQAQRIKR